VFKDERFSHLCHSLIEGPGGPACALANCRYVHKLDAYLASKGEDLGDECYVFATKGYCGRGVTCRFAKSHTDAEGRNMKGEHFDEKTPSTTCNGISAGTMLK